MFDPWSEPWWLLGSVVLPILWRWQPRRRLGIPNGSVWRRSLQQPKTTWFGYGAPLSRLLALACLLGALARPQSGHREVKRHREGLDIQLVLDTSGSMQALDFTHRGKRKDRLFVIKQVIREFIAKRPDDRIGTVVFGSQAFAQAPMTLDHEVLLQFVDAMEIGMAGEATAIGDAIAVGVNRLKDLPSKSKVMILLTDGSQTAGKLDPLEATKAAQVKGVKIYTIGVGGKGLVPIPTSLGIQQVQVDLDEGLLKSIAETTQAQYFRAYDTESLIEIYDTIDRLETTKVESKEFYHHEETFAPWLWWALVFLCLEWVWSLSRYYRLPS